MGTAVKPQPLDLVIRFSTSHPDLILRIADSYAVTALGLKRRIRDQIPRPASEARLRLIHAGKVISDKDSLRKSLGAPPPPPQDVGRKSEKARGKLPVRDSVPAARLYIHCSVGDALTSAELAEENKRAEEADEALLSHSPMTSPITADGSGPKGDGNGQGANNTTTPAPRGFDRLLATGFTPAEVATLRTQFLAIQSHTHTPDTMPTGPELLALEERWLDQSNTGNGPGSGMEDMTGDDGLDDMLWGTMVGFFWPIGVLCWLMREDGIWSRRRQLMVLLGIFINLLFGLLRLLG